MISAKRRIWLRPAKQRRWRLCRKFARCCAAKSGIRQLRAISQCNVFTPNSSRNLFASDLHGHGLAFAFATLREPGGQAFGKAKADRKSTRLNSSHRTISYAVFCLKQKSLLHD